MARGSPFTIIYAPQTYKHLGWIERKYYRLVATTIKEQLARTPTTETRNRKPLEEPASFGATWELRFGPKNSFRVFYDVDHDEKTVSVLAIGVKEGNLRLLAERSLNYEDRSPGRRESSSQCLCGRMRERGPGHYHAQRQGRRGTAGAQG